MHADVNIVDVIERAVQRLVRVEHVPGAALVQTPLMYPSGSLVSVNVRLGPNGFSMTDRGAAWEEARQLKATRSFNAHAPVVAKEAGVRLDGGAFTLHSVPVDRLSGAIATLANVAQGAVILAANRQAVVDARDAEERLFKRLSKLFGHVQTHQAVVGSSGTSWDVDAVVRVDDKVVLFESVLPRKQSIYAAVAKFHDIARMPDAPKRVAAVRASAELGSMLGVLSQAASVVEDTTSDDAFIRLAKAA